MVERIRYGAPQPALAQPLPIDVDELRATIGARVREIRLSRGATIKTVAEATGVYASHLSRVESGQASLNIGQAMKLANAYGIEVGELLGVDDLGVDDVATS
ncbi:MAG TPA: helix-turn-helix transcriptional regulator [Pseudomonadales bacterium]|nr:helix-turn-helix transcriptional regulator [Pseudomonadales bacterium]